MNLKVEALYGGQRLEQRLIYMLQMNVYICGKTLSNRIRIQKSAVKNQKPRMSYLIARLDHRDAIKEIKVLRVKCATATGMAKGIGLWIITTDDC